MNCGSANALMLTPPARNQTLPTPAPSAPSPSPGSQMLFRALPPERFKEFQPHSDASSAALLWWSLAVEDLHLMRVVAGARDGSRRNGLFNAGEFSGREHDLQRAQ